MERERRREDGSRREREGAEPARAGGRPVEQNREDARAERDERERQALVLREDGGAEENRGGDSLGRARSPDEKEEARSEERAEGNVGIRARGPAGTLEREIRRHREGERG